MNGYGRGEEGLTTSTGNDLVALQATRPERTCLPRFYSRILTAVEVAAYHRLTGLPFDHYVWLCWSVKESVYKYQKRQFPELVFAPLRIVIREVIPPDGSNEYYICKVDTLYARSLIRDGVIMTTVSDDPQFTDIHWGFQCIDSPAYADQSAAVRTLVLSALKNKFSHDDLHLQKDAAGCPIVIAGKTTIPVSLAHHDRYVGYSFRIG